jgi:hypothetical protein
MAEYYIDQNFHSYWLNLYIPSISYGCQYGHCVDGSVILKYISKKQGRRVWARIISLRMGTSGGIL